MTLNIVCVPPDLVAPTLAKCRDVFGKGFEVADRDPVDLLSDMLEGRALLWLVLDGTQAVATAMTEIVGDAVWVFGCGGSRLREWAHDLIERLADFARSEGLKVVRFTGDGPAWGRVLGVKPVGVLRGHIVFERAAA